MSNPNPANPGPGGPTRRPNNPGGNQPPRNNKVDIRVYPEITPDWAQKICRIIIRVRLVKNQQLMTQQEVVIEEGISVLWQDTTDSDGTVVFGFKENLKDTEQNKILRVTLPGLPDEKNFSIQIPALPAAPKPKEKKILVSATCIPDPVANIARITFECFVTGDGKPLIGQEISCHHGATTIGARQTSTSGRATFLANASLSEVEQIINFHFILSGTLEEEHINVSVPPGGQKPKPDTDPNRMILRRFHDGFGNFSVNIRVINVKGQGLPAIVTIWYQGEIQQVQLDQHGEHVYYAGYVEPGESYVLVAKADGIEEEASVTIKNRSPREKLKAFSAEWFRTNNCRSFFLLLAVIIAWIVTIAIGPGEAKINHRMFNDQETGLSKSEVFFNEMVSGVADNRMIQSAEPWSIGRLVFWVFLAIISILAIIYRLFAFREEIAAAIEEGLERLLDRSYARAGDPAFERIAKIIGSYHVARRTVPVVTESESNVSPASQGSASGHPSLGTLFRLDLASDALVAIGSALMKRLFR